MEISRRVIGKAAIGGAFAASAASVAQQASAQSGGSPDSTFDRIRQTKVLRVAALPGESPYFNKNIATGEWTGMAVQMANDIAKAFDAKIEYTES
ncbi:MAG: ABC transporter substrate-binding protein, partial [Microvirga sp.]